MFDKILTFYNKLFAVWIIFGGVAAYLWPPFFLPLKKFLDLFFALTMFGVGMVLDPRAFIAIVKTFKIVLIGVAAQFTIMPGLAFLITKILPLGPDFSTGIMLTGSAPGAMASNVICYLAGADVAYSVSLTTASTLLSPVLTPMLTLLLTSTVLEVSFWSMFFNLLLIVVLPVLLGIAVKHLLSHKVDPFVKIFPAISTTFIVFICALVIALNKSYLLDLTPLILVAAVLLNLLGLVLGYTVGHISNLHVMRKRTLAIEVGMQNAGLGSVLALKHFNARVAIPAVIFVFICIFTASLLAPLWSKNKQGF